MAKIDLITLTGFTATDGSIIASGATLKFDSEFQARRNDVLVRPKLYRNRELFDEGFTEVKSLEIPNEIIITLSESDLYTLTPAILYEKVRDYLNDYFDAVVFEINVIT